MSDRSADPADLSVEAPSGRTRWAPVVVALACLIFAVQFSVWSMRRYDLFLARRFDLGNMVQAVWSAAHGDLLLTSTDIVGEQVPRFAGHFEPILWLFGPLWWLWPSPNLLVVAQAVAIASSGIPAYLIARRVIGHPAIAALFCVVTLMYPFVQAQTLFDFHAVALATPLILWLVWAAVSGHDIVLGVTVVLAAATKEQVGLALFVIGLWIAIELGRRRAGTLIAVFGLVWSAVAIGLVMPHFRTAGAEVALVGRYGEFGDSVGAAVINLIVHPVRSAEILATESRVIFVLALLAPLLFLPLRAPLLAAAAVPDVLINLMSSHPQQQQLAFHYGAVSGPILIAAAIVGLGSLTRSRFRMIARLAAPPVVIPALVVVTVLASWMLGPLPFWGSSPIAHAAGVHRYTGERPPGEADVATLRGAVRLIPANAAVSAGNGVGAHLSARRRIATFPAVRGVDWIIVDTKLAAMGDGRDPVAHRERVDRLLGDPRWRLVFDRDGVLVMRRAGR